MQLSRLASPLLIAQLLELAVLATAFGFIGSVLRGPNREAVQSNVNGFYWQLLTVSDTLNGLYVALLTLYIAPLVFGVVQDARKTGRRVEAFFAVSPFYINLYIFIVFVKFALVLLCILFLIFTIISFQAPLQALQFSADVFAVFRAQDGYSALFGATIVYGVLAFVLNVELFACVYLLGWEHAVARIKG